jgi:glycosyltransferase involved in cell wall biosynthesis
MIISIIIPAKNEECNLARCLDSVISEAQLFPDANEVLVVDSFSSDNTVAVAEKYPVKILQLKAGWFHCASAARYIGSLFAAGKYIFFLDADMTLEKGFLKAALDILNSDSTIAGVGGIGRELFVKDSQRSPGNQNLYLTKDKASAARFLGGSALYRKESLLEAGSFNPYLPAAEENELAQRLRVKGYSLLSIPVPMIIHYSADIAEWDEFLRKKNAKLFSGIGQSLRLSHSAEYFLETLVYYKEFAIFLLFFFWAAGIIALTLIMRNFNYAFGILLPVAFFYLILAFKKRSLNRALLGLVKWNTISLEIIAGFIKRPKGSETYPKCPLIIKGEFNAGKY